MAVAFQTAELSRATRLKVGSIIVKDGSILSFGFNGTPAGWDNECESKEWMDPSAGGWLDINEIEEQWPYIGTYTDDDGYAVERRYRLKTKPEVIHSEANCIMKVAKSTVSSTDSTMFVTHGPCIECAKLICQSGINKVYFGKQYRDDAGVELLKKAGVSVVNLDVRTP